MWDRWNTYSSTGNNVKYMLYKWLTCMAPSCGRVVKMSALQFGGSCLNSRVEDFSSFHPLSKIIQMTITFFFNVYWLQIVYRWLSDSSSRPFCCLGWVSSGRLRFRIETIQALTQQKRCFASKVVMSTYWQNPIYPINWTLRTNYHWENVSSWQGKLMILWTPL